jgi:hypothetical protein
MQQKLSWTQTGLDASGGDTRPLTLRSSPRRWHREFCAKFSPWTPRHKVTDGRFMERSEPVGRLSCDKMPIMGRRGNPNFGSGRILSVRPAGVESEFEKQMGELKLTRDTCADSPALRRWCEENRNRCYIPEWLLKVWGITVQPES